MSVKKEENDIEEEKEDEEEEDDDKKISIVFEGNVMHDNSVIVYSDKLAWLDVSSPFDTERNDAGQKVQIVYNGIGENSSSALLGTAWAFQSLPPLWNEIEKRFFAAYALAFIKVPVFGYKTSGNLLPIFFLS